jgi:hypothetical protein
VRSLLGDQDLAGLATGGAVTALTGDVAAPVGGLAPHVMDVGEGLAAEPALPNEADLILDARLVLGATGPSGVDEEAPRLGVLEESGIDDRVLSIGLEDRRLEIVDDGSGGDAAEVLPSRLESGDDRLELLVERRIDELVAAVRERHDQGPDRAPLLSDGIGPRAHLAEVDLRLLPGGWIVEPDGRLLLSPSQLALDEPSKCRVADLDAASLKQRMDLGEGQRLFVVREPVVDGGLCSSSCVARRSGRAPSGPERHGRAAR